MNLLIKIDNNIVEAVLKENRRILDKESFELDNNLSEKLLATIDKVLRRNKLDIKDVKKAELDCNVPDSYTTYRIAKIAVDVINWRLVNS